MGGFVWPEQEAVDTWAKGYGINASAEELYELKEAVSKPRLEVQDRLRQAEAEVERLKAENAELRAVVDAAREFFEGTGCEPKECKKCDPKYINFCERSRIGQALAELDKEGEK